MAIEPTDIHAHFELVIAIVVPVVSVTVSAVMVWAALKYGLKEVIKDLKNVAQDVLELAAKVSQKADDKIVEDLKQSIKDKADKEIMESLSNEIDVINKELCSKVPLTTCGEERKGCHQDRISLNCEMSKQITLLVSALNLQDEKRQTSVEKNNDMLIKIMDKISHVELSVSREISKMQKLILERESRFRKPSQEDLMA